jgi:uncharacterized delta-60 repeat protein
MHSYLRNRAIRRAVIQSLESRTLLSAGSLDTSFGGGKVTTSYSPATAAGGDVAVQTDGKYVVVGHVGKDFLISRYNTDGSLDTTFGVTHSGKVDVHVGANGSTSYALSVAIGANGDIIAGGVASGGGETDAVLGIVRLLPNGSLDSSFGTTGQITYSGFTDIFRFATTAIAVQIDGKVLLEGTFNDSSISSDDSIGIARFNVNGSVDKTFASNGLQKANLGFGTWASSLAIDSNGSASTNSLYGTIVVAGTEQLDDGSLKVALLRLKSNGSFDSSFDGDGKTSPAYPSTTVGSLPQVAIESDNSILIAEGGVTKNVSGNILLAHYLTNGKLDTSFGGHGTGFGNAISGGSPRGIAIGYTGDIFVGDLSSSRFGVVAFTSKGLLDTTFGSGGEGSTTFSDAGQVAGIAVAPDHRIIVVGGKSTVDVAAFRDFVPNVSVVASDSTAGPTTTSHIGKKVITTANNASFIVEQDRPLPVATRVYFTLGGAAQPPNAVNIKLKKANYTLSGMTIPTSPTTTKTAYVDIPAGKTSVVVTLTPENISAATQTATFTLSSNSNYSVSSPVSQTITILGTNPALPPTTKTFTDTADSYVEDGSDAADNFGTSAKLEVKEGAAGVNRITYLKFDLSSISTANTVKLNLFGELSSSDATNVLTQLFSVADTTWTENLITFNNMPTVGSSMLASNTIVNTTPTMYTFDVTAYVKAQLAAGNKTVSFAMKNPSNSSPFVVFNSKEAGSNAPTLTIS